MNRERKKPEETFVERSNREFENERIILSKQAYELGRIRGRKETIEKACEWLLSNIHKYVGITGCLFHRRLVEDFRKAMSNSPEFEGIKTCNSDKNLQELTLEDVKRIVNIADNIIGSHKVLYDEEEYYKEVLRRFKEKGK